MTTLATHALLGLLWLLHWLPLPAQSALGAGLGAVLYRLAGSRRRVALRNLALCFPEHSPSEREALVKAHFGWLASSLLHRGLLRHASPERLLRLMRIEGDLQCRDARGRPVMWLMPHFVGLDWLVRTLPLLQSRPAVCIYQRQSNARINAWLLALRSRSGRMRMVPREEGVRPVLRDIRQGCGFLNLPDMDFGPKDSAFIPFFGVPANTLLAPSRIAGAMQMVVQPVTVTLMPRGKGVLVRAYDPLPDYPSGDDHADALRFHRWLEDRIREHPAQYLWVHKRFKTRPSGEPSLYSP